MENKPEKSHKRLLTHLNLSLAKFSLLILHRRETMYKTEKALENPLGKQKAYLGFLGRASEIRKRQ